MPSVIIGLGALLVCAGIGAILLGFDTVLTERGLAQVISGAVLLAGGVVTVAIGTVTRQLAAIRRLIHERMPLAPERPRAPVRADEDPAPGPLPTPDWPMPSTARPSGVGHGGKPQLAGGPAAAGGLGMIGGALAGAGLAATIDGAASRVGESRGSPSEPVFDPAFEAVLNERLGTAQAPALTQADERSDGIEPPEVRSAVAATRDPVAAVGTPADRPDPPRIDDMPAATDAEEPNVFDTDSSLADLFADPPHPPTQAMGTHASAAVPKAVMSGPEAPDGAIAHPVPDPAVLADVVDADGHDAADTGAQTGPATVPRPSAPANGRDHVLSPPMDDAEPPIGAPDTPASPMPAPEPTSAPTPPERTVLGVYRAAGRTYTMYADGSVEAVTEDGVERFSSLEALRAHMKAEAAQG